MRFRKSIELNSGPDRNQPIVLCEIWIPITRLDNGKRHTRKTYKLLRNALKEDEVRYQCATRNLPSYETDGRTDVDYRVYSAQLPTDKVEGFETRLARSACISFGQRYLRVKIGGRIELIKPDENDMSLEDRWSGGVPGGRKPFWWLCK